MLDRARPGGELLTGATLVRVPVSGGLGLIEQGALWHDGERILAVGPAAEVLPLVPDSVPRRELAGHYVYPALIDCHTHLVFAGDRAGEFEQKLAGVPYAQIAAAGGGIRSTVKATRAASEAELLDLAHARLARLMAEGVGTVEVKSGYGLDYATERKLLRVARQLGAQSGVRVVTTFLGLHALPPEYADRRADYVRDVADDWLPRLADEGLVDQVDAYCDHVGFSAAEVRPCLESARRLGLPVKLHAEQLSDAGGAALVAEFGGLSADHLEYLSDAGIAAMAQAGTVAVLLPGAYYVLKETRKPPVAALRAAGVPMALATDLNPGTSPLRSLRLAMNLASVLFGLSVEEALRGVTVNAARALGLADAGRLAPGCRADVLISRERPAELVYWLG
ncbi:MAG: imidazolonepropionase [Xanthomonadales bacterium]|jgi:imidazolonepropionase|nr:imidazolonepropionase [Xanthomonadales bacterium]